jgi:NitT/TauT family transport system substrate-binding protein
MAGAAGLFRSAPAFAAEGPPEVTSVRLVREISCGAPINLADELVHAEGFSELTRVDYDFSRSDVQMLMDGYTDMGAAFAADIIRELDAGTPLTVLAGLHPGCMELFAHEPISSVKELKGKSVVLPEVGYGVRLTLAIAAAYIGLDPAKDIRWISSSTPSPLEVFESGGADAYFTVPYETHDLRRRKIGRVLLRTSTDRPWSHYFCCMLVTRAEFARSNPVATKRLLRAILKATDFCAAEPRLAAERLVGDASAPGYAAALEMTGDLPYGMWREYDPEDTLRFFALRLNELGFIKADPDALIARGTDWRFLDEIKRELKV